MSLDIREWKIRRVFGYYDHNKDGFLDRGDFETHARVIAGRLGQDATDSASLLRGSQAFWGEVAQAAGIESAGRLDIDQWATAILGLRPGDPSGSTFVLHMVDVMLRSLDANGDGVLSPDEFARFYESFGGSRAQADAAFRLLDRDGNGVVDGGEFRLAIHEYFFSGDPDAPGSRLLGDPEGSAA